MMLHHQLAWYIAGPALGACVIACRLMFNARLGVTGGYSEVIGKLMKRSVSFDWRGWFLFGVILGGLLFAALAGGPDFHGYGYLTQHLHGGSRAFIAPILLLAGIVVGYGAKTAGGCTSGNGLSGSSSLSAASLAATGTFFATAIIVSFLIKAVI